MRALCCALAIAALSFHSHAMHSIPKIESPHGVIKSAVAYCIHAYKYQCDILQTKESPTPMVGQRCLYFSNQKFTERNANLCLNKDLAHGFSPSLIVTYYDKKWHSIAWEDISNLQTAEEKPISLESFKIMRTYEVAGLHNFCFKRLDLEVQSKKFDIPSFRITLLDEGNSPGAPNEGTTCLLF